jgi:hypothetical protein
MSTADSVTMLAALEGKVLTKRIRRARDGEFLIADYDYATWFTVAERPVNDLLDLGRLLASLETYSAVCIIRGRQLPSIDLARCRRLKDPDPEDGTPPSFEPAARCWLGIDIDSLPAPIWDPDKLARRREAIMRDRAERHVPATWPDDPAEMVEPDQAGDLDPAPIDPVRDWAIAIRAAVVTLPPEFHDVSCYWQMTSGAGIKPGIRLRLWYWLDRPVSDEECKRWLADAPVDCSLYGAVAIHYTAAPIFADPADDPVPIRSGWSWRHQNSVSVPELPEPKPEPRPTVPYRGSNFANSADRAQRYAAACIDSVVAAPPGTGKGRSTFLAVARKLFGMANAGLLDDALVAAELRGAMANRGWTGQGRSFSADEVERHLAWARSHADTTLPEGFR